MPLQYSVVLTHVNAYKDLNAPPADVAVTLNGVSHIVTQDLARDLSPELMAMMNHSRANIRKRAVVAMYKVILKYPECAERAMSRLREKLEDSDPGTLSLLHIFPVIHTEQSPCSCYRGHRQCSL
jgi:AP-3 complex subunit delta-1